VEEKMQAATDYNEKLYYWKEWHDKVGSSTKPAPKDFIEKLNYENSIAVSNGI
jgi:hypothetical protein